MYLGAHKKCGRARLVATEPRNGGTPCADTFTSQADPLRGTSPGEEIQPDTEVSMNGGRCSVVFCSAVLRDPTFWVRIRCPLIFGNSHMNGWFCNICSAWSVFQHRTGPITVGAQEGTATLKGSLQVRFHATPFLDTDRLLSFPRLAGPPAQSFPTQS